MAEEITETVVTEQSITTGEAVAEVESNNEVNNNSAVTEGTVDGCQIELNCSNQNDNGAILEIGNSVVATTGENQSTNNNNTDINVNTGEAVAGITNQNQVNTNTLEVATTLADIGGTETEIVENNNQAEVTAENSSVAGTGENEVVTNNADVVVNTGGATAYINVINLINTNVVGTSLGIYVVNNFDQGWADLDLNQMWLKLINGNGVTVIESGINHNKMVVISNKNLAKLNNVVTVAAVSGENTVTGGDEVLIITGDAVAIANVINLVNVNLVGGQFFIGVVNVLGGNLGNIVLPNPNNFQNNGNTTSGGNGSVVINNNQAVLDNTVVAESDSGNNTTINVDQSIIGTGNATTYSSDLSVVNLNAELNNQMWLQLNVLGETNGKIYNWSYPGSVEEINNNQLLFVLNENGCLNCQSGNNFLINDNSAEVTSSVLVTADSGGNQILGASDGVIESGSATAIANLTNLVNVNIYGSDWFWGIINILGDWGGDVIFAYPDLAVNLMANKNESRSGEEIIYRINYSNLGYEKVDEAELKINLPVGLDYISDDSGWLLVQEGNKLKWKLNNVAAKSNGGFTLRVKINNLNDDRDVQLQTVAMITTNSVESDLNNNQSVWATIVWRSLSENNFQNQENNDSDKETKIVVEAKNNVNDYVLPNDTVTFLIEIKNVGTGKMKEAVLFHQVFDGRGNLWSENSLYLGEIEINKIGKMSFGLVMNEAGGKYTTKTWIVGLDENNNEVSSNVAETNFWVKRKIMLERGQVLGAENDVVYEGPVNNGICVVKKEKLIYVLLLLVSLMYIQRQVGIWRRKLK
ncbi:MAG: hypothetical protein KIH89_003535 [Candidatus Shapirobacteria bacterium]|nr:hypothetical protein [Candidatus Shapirobacteria bacterium]